MWAVKKMRNIIKSSTKPIILYIDYSAIIDIVKIINLALLNIDKLNNKFICINQYLSQFQFDVRYKSEKYHIISNALSKLLTKSKSISNFHKSDNIFNNINNFYVILIEISDTFRNELR
jgi:hypothetical protein